MASNKDYIKEYIEYVELDKKKPHQEQELLAYLVDSFLKLGFQPKESLDDFKIWFGNRMQRYTISPLQLEYVIDNFIDYWSGVDKKIKNHKTTFFNGPIIRRHLKNGYDLDTI